MILNLVKYTDKQGWTRQAYVPSGVSPERGLPYNPPDVTGLNIDIEDQIRLHNALVERGLITYQDVLDSAGGLKSLLTQLGLLHIRRELITLYKLAK